MKDKTTRSASVMLFLEKITQLGMPSKDFRIKLCVDNDRANGNPKIMACKEDKEDNVGNPGSFRQLA